MIIAAIGITAVVIGVSAYAAIWTHRRCQQIEAEMDRSE
jgi:hypothetical protein